MSPLGAIRRELRNGALKRFGVPARWKQKHWLYGQGLEDLYLLRLFADRAPGFYVDVGAGDGVFLSNSYALYRRGWRGICVEPNPTVHAELRRRRPLDTNLQIALGRHAGRAELSWSGKVTEGGSLRSAAIGEQHCEVEVRPLTAVLDEHAAPRAFDLLSLDVEGHELDVLESLDWSRYAPRIVLFEYNTGGRVGSAALEYLLQRGYRPVLVNRWNIIASRDWAADIVRVHGGQRWFTLG